MNKAELTKLLAQVVKVITVPELGEVHIRHIPYRVLGLLDQDAGDPDEKILKTVALALCDEGGKVLFDTWQECGDTLPFSVISFLYEAIIKRYVVEPVSAAKKNCSTTPNCDTSSESPSVQDVTP